MSLVSKISIKAAMNLTDFIFKSAAILTWCVIIFILFSGFITPYQYNYCGLKPLGKSCHLNDCNVSFLFQIAPNPLKVSLEN